MTAQFVSTTSTETFDNTSRWSCRTVTCTWAAKRQICDALECWCQLEWNLFLLLGHHPWHLSDPAPTWPISIEWPFPPRKDTLSLLLPLVLKTLLGLFVVLTPPSHTTRPLHLASLLLLPASILIITWFFTVTTTFRPALPHPCCPFVQLIYSTARTSLALIVWVTIAQCVIKHFLALNKRQQLEKVMECG